MASKRLTRKAFLQAKAAKIVSDRDKQMIRRCADLTESFTLQATVQIAQAINELHPVMTPPTLAQVGLGLMMNGMCLDFQAPPSLKPRNPDPKGPSSQVEMLEHVLGSIAKIAAEHGVELSYRIAENGKK